ncbi:MAG: AIR synthase related protein [Micromonosporaceae bacterium]
MLVVSIDGVGETLRLAKPFGRHDTIGLDDAALAISDVAASGADLMFATCNAAYRMGPDHVDEVTAGVAEACRQVRCALVARPATESAASARATNATHQSPRSASSARAHAGHRAGEDRRHPDRPAVVRPARQRVTRRC